MSDKLFCSHCGAALQSADKFCSSCGRKRDEIKDSKQSEIPHKTEIICSACGVPNASTSVQCFSCGVALTKKIPPDGGIEPPKSSKKTVGKEADGRKVSFSLQLAAAFVVLVLLIIFIESQNRPSGGSGQVPQQNSDQQMQPVQPDQNMLGQIKILENSIKTDSNNTESLLQLANLLHDAKMFPRAIEYYKKVVKKNKNLTDARVDLGICYFEIGEVETAVKEIKKAIEIDPKHQMAMFNLGVILLSSDRNEESKKWLQKAIDIDPKSVAGQKAKEILHQH